MSERDDLKARVKELDTCNQLNATEMQRYQIQSARLESERGALKAELERVYAHNHDLEDAIAMGEHTVEVLEGRLATVNQRAEFWERRNEATAEAIADVQGCLVVANVDDENALAGYVRELGKQLETARGQIERRNEMVQALVRQVEEQAREYGVKYTIGLIDAALALANGAGRSASARETLARMPVIDDPVITEAMMALEEQDGGTGDVVLGEGVTELARSKRTTASGGIQQIDAHGTEAPNCATCRREDCWPDCARFYDEPELPQ